MLNSRLRAYFFLGVWFHRLNEYVESGANACAVNDFLARPSASTGVSCAALALHATIEGCSSYARVQLAPQQLLVLLLLLLLARPLLRRPSCCSHLKEVTTPLATHAPPLLLSVLKQQRALPLWPLQMRPEEMQKCQPIRRCSIRRPRC